MITSGLSEENVALIKELEAAEREFLGMTPSLPPEMIAQALTCLACDYVSIGLEEKGNLLLLKANEIYRGYHGSQKMKDQMEADPDFKFLVEELGKMLLSIAFTVALDGKV
jgi:hypothetical protein